MSPSFLAIWGVEPWGDNWKRPRRYYKTRSVVRMAFWIPLVSFNIIAILGLAVGR